MTIRVMTGRKQISMRPEMRIVTQLPLARLWNDEGDLKLDKQRDVGIEQITNLLRQGSVSFVVANGGERLNWIAEVDTHRFWKDEVKPHLVESQAAEDGFHLEDYPGEYCYTASEWRGQGNLIAILFEKHH
ncbi:MAG: hypothetical protein JWP89_5450 [Schlesneria sp.]|nr:hypothetical protein [Schlesneria sp.]